MIMRAFVYWAKEDLHATKERLKPAGYAVSEMVEREYGQSEFFVTDDDGFSYCGCVAAPPGHMYEGIAGFAVGIEWGRIVAFEDSQHNILLVTQCVGGGHAPLANRTEGWAMIKWADPGAPCPHGRLSRCCTPTEGFTVLLHSSAGACLPCSTAAPPYAGKQQTVLPPSTTFSSASI